MTGLIVKGATALFFDGADPASSGAISIVNRYRGTNQRSWEGKLRELNLEHIPRPRPLSRTSLAWAYVFVALTEGDVVRLEPGPFDDELAGVVRAIEAERG